MFDKNQPELVQQPPFYFPLENGLYEVKPGLFKFPHDFGQLEQDGRIFQIDMDFSRYRYEKLCARKESLAKYYCTDQFEIEISGKIHQFIINKLVHEHPDLFDFRSDRNSSHLICRLTGDSLSFDADFQLLDSQSDSDISPNYIDGFDALACQLQEDLSVIKLDVSGGDQTIALHLCLPNHWAASEKIGKGFISVHEPVPHMDKMNLSAGQLMDSIIHKGPFVRFAWGIATDNRLNHHPEPNQNVAFDEWQGRQFDPGNPELYLRIERQTLHGFPDSLAALFTIRTYIYEMNWIHNNYPEHIPSLINAIESMSVESLRYKGLKKDAPVILGWLRSLQRQ